MHYENWGDLSLREMVGLEKMSCLPENKIWNGDSLGITIQYVDSGQNFLYDVIDGNYLRYWEGGE